RDWHTHKTRGLSTGNRSHINPGKVLPSGVDRLGGGPLDTLTVFVDGFAYALGGRRGHVRDSPGPGRLISAPGRLESRGSGWHRACEPQTGAYELARQATRRTAAGHRLESVDVLVYSTCLPLNGNVGDVGRWERTRDVKHLMDFPAGRLQAEFGMDRAFV